MPPPFDAAPYSPEVTRILDALPHCPLGPGEPRGDLRNAIAALDLPPACMAGLWLRANFLHESHAISQDLTTSEGSFWHAVMHRREPDAWNSKYWWRQVGAHPVLKALAGDFPEYATPERFVDFCERVRGKGSTGERRAAAIQNREWELMFSWCQQTVPAGS